MDKIALYIPRPGQTSLMIQGGYVDTLRHCGWKVYVCDPKTKIGCRKLIEEYGIKLIMTNSRHGTRQLPIDIINMNDIAVFVNILPLNSKNINIDGPYELSHSDEPDLIKSINRVVLHTSLEKHIWEQYMSGWLDSNIDIQHVPVAGNIINAIPPVCSILTDVAMVANFIHKQNVMRTLIEPLFKHIDLLGYSYQVFGDKIWGLAGLNSNGYLVGDVKKLAHIYATAKVCPNVHTEKQIALQAYVNERSFMIPLCGGIQISDNHMVTRYLGENCEVAVSITDFITKVIRLIEDQSQRSVKIKKGIEHVANNHTYFNRLEDLLAFSGLLYLADDVCDKGKRFAVRHCLELNARLSAEERGIPYGKEEIGIA